MNEINNPMGSANSLDSSLNSLESKIVSEGDVSKNKKVTLQKDYHNKKKSFSNLTKYYIYLLIHLGLITYFILNFIVTSNCYEEGNMKYINMRAPVLCANYIETLQQCVEGIEKSNQLIYDLYINSTRNNETDYNLTNIDLSGYNITILNPGSQNDTDVKLNKSHIISVNVTPYRLAIINLNQIDNETAMHNRIVKNTKKFCRSENDNVKTCFDSYNEFSKICQFYIYDLYECKIKEKKSLKKCLTINMVNCAIMYPLVNVSKVFDYLE